MSNGTSRPWYENALLLAVAGSIIAVIGQLAGTVIPIMYGPEDVSDFSVAVDPVEATLFLFPESNAYAISPPVWNVRIENYHSILRPYRFGVLLKNLGTPEGMALKFHLAEIHPGDVSRMNFSLSDPSSLAEGEYPIAIQGIGGDGRTRNTTFFLYVRQDNLTAYNRRIGKS